MSSNTVHANGGQVDSHVRDPAESPRAAANDRCPRASIQPPMPSASRGVQLGVSSDFLRTAMIVVDLQRDRDGCPSLPPCATEKRAGSSSGSRAPDDPATSARLQRRGTELPSRRERGEVAQSRSCAGQTAPSRRAGRRRRELVRSGISRRARWRGGPPDHTRWPAARLAPARRGRRPGSGSCRRAGRRSPRAGRR